MMAKSDINGANTCEIYKFLRIKSRLFNAEKNEARVVPWNFTKFIVAGDLSTVDYFNPRHAVEEVEAKIQEVLGKQEVIIE